MTLDNLANIAEIVGDIRALGLFAGIEFVRNKQTKAWFEPHLKVNQMIANTAFERGLITYPGGGGVDGDAGHPLDQSLGFDEADDDRAGRFLRGGRVRSAGRISPYRHVGRNTHRAAEGDRAGRDPGPHG